MNQATENLKNQQIVERLNKELVNYKSIGKTGDDNYDEETGDVINLLKEILGEEK